MRILQIINAFFPPYSSGGPAIGAHYISKFLVKRGHEVTVYTSNIRDERNLFMPKHDPYTIDGVNIYYFKNEIYKHSLHLYLSTDFIHKIKTTVSNYDLIHIHEYRSYLSIVTAYYAWKYHIPLVLHAHGQLQTRFLRPMRKLLFDALLGYRILGIASRVIALNSKESEQYRAMGVPQDKIVIIPNGIDLSEYDNPPSKGSFRRKFGIDDDEKVVLYLGRIHKIKGIDILVKAFSTVIKTLDHVKLAIVGSDDGYLDELKALIEDLELRSNVLISGPLYGRGKLEAYIDADVYVLPSRYETFPNSLLEAYALGRPVIASKVGGLEDLVVDRVTGLLFENGNAKKLASHICFLLRNNGKASEIGSSGEQFVKENFSITKVTNKLEDLYRNILSK